MNIFQMYREVFDICCQGKDMADSRVCKANWNTLSKLKHLRSAEGTCALSQAD